MLTKLSLIPRPHQGSGNETSQSFAWSTDITRGRKTWYRLSGTCVTRHIASCSILLYSGMHQETKWMVCMHKHSVNHISLKKRQV